MRAFVTGATGFIGGTLARRLRERGDEVVTLVRSPDRAGDLRDLGCHLVDGSLSSRSAIAEGVRRCDAVFHVAAMYEVGLPRRERGAMFEANVRGTERVLDAAIEAGVPRIVHVSTVNVFGNTRGRVVDEAYRRPQEDGYLSYYDQTKYLAHQVAVERIARGAPVVIAMPGAVYGPDDPSQLGNLMHQVRTRKLKFRTFPEAGFVYLHVDDCADGIMLVHDRGRVGESYVLGGERSTVGTFIDTVARLAGVPPPRLNLPAPLVKMAVPIGPLVGRLMGFPPNLGELIRVADGVTCWASDEKARRELGYAPRDLETGLRQILT